MPGSFLSITNCCSGDSSGGGSASNVSADTFEQTLTSVSSGDSFTLDHAPINEHSVWPKYNNGPLSLHVDFSVVGNTVTLLFDDDTVTPLNPISITFQYLYNV